MWRPFDNGSTLATVGSEGGPIVRDEEHDLGARITLEQQCRFAPFAITCGLYGWFFHTCFFAGREEAEGTYDAMRAEIGRIAALLGEDPVDSGEARRQVLQSISQFVERFPT